MNDDAVGRILAGVEQLLLFLARRRFELPIAVAMAGAPSVATLAAIKAPRAGPFSFKPVTVRTLDSTRVPRLVPATTTDPASGRSGLDEPAHRAIGRARTDLEFLSAAKLLDGLPDRLLGLQRTVSTVSEEVTRRMFAGSPPLNWSVEEPVG